jgi:hypothetical protein
MDVQTEKILSSGWMLLIDEFPNGIPRRSDG